LFRTWGYQDVIPPMFEYADTVSQRSSKQLQAELYRFLDRDGSTLTLRSDMTIAIARLVGVRLHDRPMPQRFCYAGSVFRHTEMQAGRQREFTQAGFELIGAPGPAADAEVIALTVQAMRAASVQNFKIVVGQLHFFHALLQELSLTPEQTAHLQSAVLRNSEAELANFLRTTPLRTQQRHTVEQLPLLSGPDAQAVIAHADRLCLNYAMHKALANLRDIHLLLEGYGITVQVYIDLTEINNLGYYTGISFEILVPGLGFALGGGGRYDNLIGTFGAPQPAVGVAIGIDRLMNVQRAADTNAEINKGFASTTPAILVASNNSAASLAIVNQWRRAGLRVVATVDGTQGEDLWRMAQSFGIALAATWTGQGFDIYGATQESTQTPLFVPQNDSAAVMTWATQLLSKPQSGAQTLDAQSPTTITRLSDKETLSQSEELYGLRS